MTLKYTLGCALYVGSLVLARPAVVDPDLNISDSTIKVNSLPVYALSVLPTTALPIEPITSLDITGGEDIHIQCDGPSYGSDLDISDCGEANAYLAAGSDQYQWAERHSGSQKESLALPYRSMGDKASCYVQPVLINGASSARATFDEIRNAAAMIRGRCFSGGKLQGGMATKIGKMKTLTSAMPWQVILWALDCFAYIASEC